MATIGGVLWFVVFLVVATVLVLAAAVEGIVLVGLVLVGLGLLLSPVLVVALGLLLLLKRSRPVRTEITPRVPGAAPRPSPTGPATEPSRRASAEAPAGVVHRAA